MKFIAINLIIYKDQKNLDQICFPELVYIFIFAFSAENQPKTSAETTSQNCYADNTPTQM